MEQFAINKEDLIGLTGKVVVITGSVLPSLSACFVSESADLKSTRGLIGNRPRNNISAPRAWSISRGW